MPLEETGQSFEHGDVKVVRCQNQFGELVIVHISAEAMEDYPDEPFISIASFKYDIGRVKKQDNGGPDIVEVFTGDVADFNL